MRTTLPKNLMLFLFAIWMTSCLKDGGTEIPNELTGTVESGGSPAAGVEIRLIPVNYAPGSQDSVKSAILTARTDAQGRFSLKDASPGTYNLIAESGGLSALLDSVGVTGKRQELGNTLLRPPGALVGKVELEPLDSPRNAVVEVLGTTVYVNVEEDGTFAMKELPEGPYRLKVSVSLPLYAPLIREAEVRSGLSDTLTPALKPFYSGIPSVLGLEVRPAPPGLLKLNWQPTSFSNFDGYLIYRDSAGALLPSTAPIARTRMNHYTDTLYASPPKPGQHSFQDTLSHEYSYRVRIIDANGDIGRSLAPVVGVGLPPSTLFSSGWKKLQDGELPAAPAGGLFTSFRDSAWYFVEEGGSMRIFISSDFKSWKERIPLDSMRMGQFLVFQERLWLLATRPAVEGDSATPDNPIVNSVWSTADGIHWKEATHAAPFQGRQNSGFAAFNGRMWVVGGSRNWPSPITDIWSSADGKTWTPAGGQEFLGFGGAVIGFRGALFQVGGGNIARGDYPVTVQRTDDGKKWTSHSAPGGLLPRMAHSLVEHDGKIWVIGGFENVSQPAVFKPLIDVWSSDDGLDWTLRDARAPFGDRRMHGAVSLRGTLYVAGGYSDSGDAEEVWVLE